MLKDFLINPAISGLFASNFIEYNFIYTAYVSAVRFCTRLYAL